MNLVVSYCIFHLYTGVHMFFSVTSLCKILSILIRETHILDCSKFTLVFLLIEKRSQLFKILLKRHTGWFYSLRHTHQGDKQKITILNILILFWNFIKILFIFLLFFFYFPQFIFDFPEFYLIVSSYFKSLYNFYLLYCFIY